MRGSFPAIVELIPKCEKIKKLSAICKLCKLNGSFTYRTAAKEAQNLIGGDNMYMPLCRECHAREMSLNAENVFQGDPSKVNVEVENEAQGINKLSKTPGSTEDATMESDQILSNSESPEAKSFGSDSDLSNSL